MAGSAMARISEVISIPRLPRELLDLVPPRWPPGSSEVRIQSSPRIVANRHIGPPTAFDCPFGFRGLDVWRTLADVDDRAKTMDFRGFPWRKVCRFSSMRGVV